MITGSKILILLTSLFTVNCSIAGCEKKIGQQTEGKAIAIKISKFNPSDNWGESQPIEFTPEGTTFAISMEPDGGNFSGWVKIEAYPGDVSEIKCNPPSCDQQCPGEKVINTNVQIANVRVDVCVTVKKSFGKSYITAEDIGFIPVPPSTAKCSDGVDNDGDTKIDYPYDEGCAFLNDDSERGGSHIAGISPPIFFENPTIADIQGYSSYSPLTNKSVTVENKFPQQLVVTRISIDGFYVTDLHPKIEGEGFNHIFVYNYHTPWGLKECDTLTYLSGVVGEFFGYTELNYPAWKIENYVNCLKHESSAEKPPRCRKPLNAQECPIPEPVTITEQILSNAYAIESLEAGLVKIEHGVVSSNFVDCDYNHNGQVEWEGQEKDCQDQCNSDPSCTELTQYRKYGQWIVTIGGKKIFVVSRNAYPEFNPMAHKGQTIHLIRGTLRQVEFIEPPWIVEIRCREDLYPNESDEIVPIYRACVPELPRGEFYDNN